jgi:hypothetical protein
MNVSAHVVYTECKDVCCVVVMTTYLRDIDGTRRGGGGDETTSTRVVRGEGAGEG